MEDDRRRRARQVMVDLDVGEDWFDVVDPDSPEWLREWVRDTYDTWRTGDLDRMLGQSHPEIVIVQPHELPDARTYHGKEGVVDALLDWPREWEDFAVEPKRVFAIGEDRVVVDTIHRGRSLRMGIEIEAPITWLFKQESGLTRRWDMFTSVADALEAAGPPDAPAP
jgi:ketosteroid isomerase-like protein